MTAKPKPADEMRVSGTEFDWMMGQVLGASPAKAQKPERTASRKEAKPHLR